MKQFEDEQEKINKNVDEYISNPIEAFTLIKRLTNDSLLIKENILATVDDFSSRTSHLCPKKNDLLGAIQGIDRLQKNYHLKTSDLANGFIYGDQYDAKLNAQDLYVIGKEFYEMKRFPQSIEYLTEALKQPKAEFSEVPVVEFLLSLTEAYKSNGNYEKAMQTIDAAINLKSEMAEEILEMKKSLELDFHEGNIQAPEIITERLEVKLTRQVCSGELHLSATQLSKFHCRYVSYSAFSKLAPFKLEEIHLDPTIVVYHQAISESEIEVLKNLASSKLEQSVVFGSKGDQKRESDVRISEVAWFTDSAHEVVDRISRRIEEMTGLSTKTAELLQIQKYGIAGFYKSHYDFMGDIKTDAVGFEYGDRIATFLLYVRKFYSEKKNF